jgi:hypothetical protein
MTRTGIISDAHVVNARSTLCRSRFARRGIPALESESVRRLTVAGAVRRKQGERVLAGAERERQAGLRGRGTMLDGEDQAIIGTSQIEIRIARGVELWAAP